MEVSSYYYCPACDEACPLRRDHERICAVCGAELQRLVRRQRRRQEERVQPPPPQPPSPAAAGEPPSSSSPRGTPASTTRRPARAESERSREDNDGGRGGEGEEAAATAGEGAERYPPGPPPRGDGAAAAPAAAGAEAEENAEILLLMEQTISDLFRLRQRGVVGVAEEGVGTTAAAGDLRELAASLARAQTRRRQGMRRLADLAGAPSSLPSSSSRPTAPAYLDRIPRMTLTPESTVFSEATVSVNGTPYRAVPGDFGVNHLAHRVRGAAIVHCGTGRGGIEGEEATARIRQLVATPSVFSSDDNAAAPAAAPPKPPLVLMFDRGGDVTFVQKALLAQQAGACAAIIANHVSQPWPYRMSDSASEARGEPPLRIPVVMIRKEDARAILSGLRQSDRTSDGVMCDVEILPAGKSAECAVCLQPMNAGETIMVLPDCRHAFHEACAATWLRSHHTCPYCRSELPTDAGDGGGPNGGGIGGGRNENNRGGHQPRGVDAIRGNPSNSGIGDFYG